MVRQDTVFSVSDGSHEIESPVCYRWVSCFFFLFSNVFILCSDWMPGLDCVPAARLQRSRPLPPLQWRGQMSPWLLCLCAEKGWDKNNYIHYMNNEHEYCSWHDAFQTSSVVSGGVVTQTTFCIQTTDSQNRRIVSFQARISIQINSAQLGRLTFSLVIFPRTCSRAPLWPARSISRFYHESDRAKNQFANSTLHLFFSSHIIRSQMATTVPWLILLFLLR